MLLNSSLLCFVPSLQVIHDYPSIRQVNLICNTTNLGVVAPLGYNGLLILSCTFYAFKVLAREALTIMNTLKSKGICWHLRDTELNESMIWKLEDCYVDYVSYCKFLYVRELKRTECEKLFGCSTTFLPAGKLDWKFDSTKFVLKSVLDCW